MNIVRWLVITFCILLLLAVPMLMSGFMNDSPKSQSSAARIKNVYLTTIEHDKHLFIVVGHNQDILHHPDCKCLKIEK